MNDYEARRTYFQTLQADHAYDVAHAWVVLYGAVHENEHSVLSDTHASADDISRTLRAAEDFVEALRSITP